MAAGGSLEVMGERDALSLGPCYCDRGSPACGHVVLQAASAARSHGKAGVSSSSGRCLTRSPAHWSRPLDGRVEDNAGEWRSRRTEAS